MRAMFVPLRDGVSLRSKYDYCHTSGLCGVPVACADVVGYVTRLCACCVGLRGRLDVRDDFKHSRCLWASMPDRARRVGSALFCGCGAGHARGRVKARSPLNSQDSAPAQIDHSNTAQDYKTGLPSSRGPDAALTTRLPDSRGQARS